MSDSIAMSSNNKAFYDELVGMPVYDPPPQNGDVKLDLGGGRSGWVDLYVYFNRKNSNFSEGLVYDIEDEIVRRAGTPASASDSYYYLAYEKFGMSSAMIIKEGVNYFLLIKSQKEEKYKIDITQDSMKVPDIEDPVKLFYLEKNSKTLSPNDYDKLLNQVDRFWFKRLVYGGPGKVIKKVVMNRFSFPAEETTYYIQGNNDFLLDKSYKNDEMGTELVEIPRHKMLSSGNQVKGDYGGKRKTKRRKSRRQRRRSTLKRRLVTRRRRRTTLGHRKR
jgi:hypothetical protein